MKRLLSIIACVYFATVTGCATTDMAKVENDYQKKVYQEKLDKMAGKPINCEFHPTPTNIVDKNRQQLPNFTYSTPKGEPCLP